MRIAWLVDDCTPASWMTGIVAAGRALHERGHEVAVVARGADSPQVSPPIVCPSVAADRVSDVLGEFDAVIGTHWSHAGPCLDVGTAAPFLFVAGVPDRERGFWETLRNLPVGVLSGSREALAEILSHVHPRGGVHLAPVPVDGSGCGGLEDAIRNGAGALERIIEAAVVAHRARIREHVTVGLAMIVRDEQENLLRCLDSVRSVVDEIVVVDTGSRDATVRVARDAGALVVEAEWRNDFAAARNVALEHLTSDWVLVLDADEQLAASSGPLIRKAIRNPLVDGFLLDIVNFTGHVSVSGGVVHSNLRLFRRLPGVRYEGALHEQVAPALLRAGGVVRPLPGAAILHYGYLGGAVEAYDKRSRNLEIVRRQAEEDPGNPFVQFNLGMEYMRQGDRARAIKVFQRAFRLLPGPNVAFAPGLVRHLATCLMDEQRYGEALQVLEEGSKMYPQYVDLRFLRGVTLNRLGRYEDALEAFDECLRMGDSTGLYSFSQLGAGGFLARAASVESYLALGRLDEAVQAQRAAEEEMRRRFGEVLPGLPGSGAEIGLWVKAETLTRQGRLEEALSAYRELLSPDRRRVFLSTQLAQLWARKAVLELAAGHAAEAREDLCHLRGVSPKGARAAEMLLRPWLEGSGGSPGAGDLQAGDPGGGGGREARVSWWNAGPVLAALLDAGRRDWFNRVCELLRGGLMEPGELDVELGKLFFHRGLREEAARHLLAGVRAGCADPAALRLLGDISAARGLQAEARAFFREAVRRRPADAAAWVSLALAYHRAGNDRAGLRVLDLARRYAGGEVILTARMALGLHRQLSSGDEKNERARPRRGAGGRCEGDTAVERVGARLGD